MASDPEAVCLTSCEVDSRASDLAVITMAADDQTDGGQPSRNPTILPTAPWPALPSEPDPIELPPIQWDEPLPPDCPEPFWRPFVTRAWRDHRHYYSSDGIGILGVGVGIAAILANTDADESLHRRYQDKLRDMKTDEAFEAMHASKDFGDGLLTIPVFAASAVAGSYLFDDTCAGSILGEWGGRSLRTVLVGAPPMLAMQWVTGGSRPGESEHHSRWQPFDDTNGVSGHSFMGAVPFLSAAKMADAPLWKAGFYAASTLPGLSRINDDRHYASQVLLGWWMAFAAASAVDATQRELHGLVVTPVVEPDLTGVAVDYRW